jgi:serine/threonine protein kinase
VRQQILNERFVMGDVEHPFIAKLHATFKTSLSLFMVLEPCLGGELFSYMQRLEILPEQDARFYASCVAAALEHLHTRHVVYRDLKPEVPPMERDLNLPPSAAF